jgi:DNA-binding PadR family transcriptional regulator
MSEDGDIRVQNLTRLYTIMILNTNESATGYSILKRLDKDLGKTASPTYVYEFLNMLKSKGYIRDVKKSKTKRSKGFYLTSSGKEFVNRIMMRFNNLVELSIQSKIKVCASCGVKLYEDYYTEKIGDEEMNFCCTHCAKAFKSDSPKM